jgi:hypothetical protein
MTASALLQAIRHLPDDAQVTLTVAKADLVRSLEERDDRPERIMPTTWFADNLGMSRRWWASECHAGRIPGAHQEVEGGPWYLPIGAGRAHLEEHRSGRTHTRSRRRGPRSARGAQ